MVIIRLFLLGLALFFLALATNLSIVDGFLGIDFTVMDANSLNMFKYSFFVMFTALMLAFAFIGGDR